ncbi:MAG: hypothetical protein LBF83_10745, partial [Spirochaetaceae bacterium]|nr:hypothetical protein [Spirochaetaceae bacterium]
INNILEQFSPCFNRAADWINFCTIIIGFIMRSDLRAAREMLPFVRNITLFLPIKPIAISPGAFT